MPGLRASRSRLLGLVLLSLGVLVLTSPVAQGQITREKPAQVKAANRRAQRDAQHAESPYKDSHLAVKPARLRRGQSAPPQATDRNEGNNEVDFEPAPVARAKPAGFLGLRRKNKPPPRRAAPTERN